jgi:hypothetical protein
VLAVQLPRIPIACRNLSWKTFHPPRRTAHAATESRTLDGSIFTNDQPITFRERRQSLASWLIYGYVALAAKLLHHFLTIAAP